MDQADVQVQLEELAGAKQTLSQLNEDAGGFPSDTGTKVNLALLKAQTGDISPAQHLLSTAGNGNDQKNTVLLFCDLPSLRATLDLKAHKAADAVQLLEPARPYQLRDFWIPYLRAQAETEAGMLDAAAADYRLILNNQGVDPLSPIYSLSHLRLARVLALQKKSDEARSEYTAFFEAWKDADPELKILADAKREYAQLR